MAKICFTSIVTLSAGIWLLAGCGSKGGSTTVLEPSTSIIGSTSSDMSRSAWDPPMQGINWYTESDSSTVTPVGGASTTTVVDSDFIVGHSENVSIDSNGNQIQVINAQSTNTDTPPPRHWLIRPLWHADPMGSSMLVPGISITTKKLPCGSSTSRNP